MTIPFVDDSRPNILTFPEQGGPGIHLPLVVHPDIEFHAGEITLEPLDRLVVYTDGLTEMSISQMKNIN